MRRFKADVNKRKGEQNIEKRKRGEEKGNNELYWLNSRAKYSR